jgi:hypothetical protein
LILSPWFPTLSDYIPHPWAIWRVQIFLTYYHSLCEIGILYWCCTHIVSGMGAIWDTSVLPCSHTGVLDCHDSRSSQICRAHSLYLVDSVQTRASWVCVCDQRSHRSLLVSVYLWVLIRDP